MMVFSRTRFLPATTESHYPHEHSPSFCAAANTHHEVPGLFFSQSHQRQVPLSVLVAHHLDPVERICTFATRLLDVFLLQLRLCLKCVLGSPLGHSSPRAPVTKFSVDLLHVDHVTWTLSNVCGFPSHLTFISCFCGLLVFSILVAIAFMDWKILGSITLSATVRADAATGATVCCRSCSFSSDNLRGYMDRKRICCRMRCRWTHVSDMAATQVSASSNVSNDSFLSFVTREKNVTCRTSSTHHLPLTIRDLLSS